tara:strand:- start:4177 stop:4458 length:282 start_codon:yes stop_codon:yes gene_type:complete
MLTKQEITALQTENGLDDVQNIINNGSAWRMEGSVGRMAMEYLKSGACFLPDEGCTDYYGNKIPSINEVEEGSVGSLSLSSMYWGNITKFMED